MKRGLYVRAGDCATARLAACAISLFGPTTNDSKVFRGLRPSAVLDCLASRVFWRANSFSEISGKISSSNFPGTSEAQENFTARGEPKALTIAAWSAAI